MSTPIVESSVDPGWNRHRHTFGRPWVTLGVLGMFFADSLWRVPLYLEDLSRPNVGGAGFSLTVAIVELVVLALLAVVLWRGQRWGAPCAAIVLLVITAFIGVNFDRIQHRLVAGFAMVLAIAGVAGLWPMHRRRVSHHRSPQ